MKLALDHSLTLLLGHCYYYFPYFCPIKWLAEVKLEEGKKERRRLWVGMRIASNMSGEILNQSAASMWTVPVISNLIHVVNEIEAKLYSSNLAFQCNRTLNESRCRAPLPSDGKNKFLPSFIRERLSPQNPEKVPIPIACLQLSRCNVFYFPPNDCHR